MSNNSDQVESLFAAAAQLTGESRKAFLDRECAGQAVLLEQVDGLLRAHDRVNHPLDQPALEFDGLEATCLSDSQAIGTIIAGRYKLLERIGDGGMGTVWMAEQKEPVKRLVAVKLIKAGMDSKAVLARFEAERQALALMDHPNIAKIHDAGTDANGRPYFAMELVKGLPLTEYCDTRKLTVNERLDLFVQICSAVQHAHQKAIIHRDLKPTNVLVTEHDGKPMPKVIDFGLAKALNSSQMLTDRTLHTAYGTVVGTPLYMAPEQVGINALDVDTRTVIYALGVILYELLTGTMPLEKAKFKEAAWEEMKRLIREEEPPRTSTRLSSDKTLPSLAASRQVDAAKLPGLVRGELDWIVMKALEKDRSRRYETANGLAKDVQRFLKGDTVEACPPTLGYRLRKAYRKNRGAILTTMSIAALLLIATGVSLAFGILAKQSAQRADESARQANDSERDAQQRLAELVEARRQQVESDYLMSIQFADAGYRNGNLDTARSLLKMAPQDRRGWEWNYLNRLCQGDHLYSFEGNDWSFTACDFNHDGTRIITNSHAKTVEVWDTRTGQLQFELQGDEGEQIGWASFSPNGRRILTDSYSGVGDDQPRSVKVWDAKSGKLIMTLYLDTDWGQEAAFSPDSKWIVTTHTEKKIAKVWDADTGEEKVTLQGHTDEVTSAVFIRNSTRLFTASDDKTARVWDIETGMEVCKFEELTDRLSEVACSPGDDGRTAATHSWGPGQGVKIWDSETGKEKFKLGDDSEGLLAPRFSPDGMRIIAYNSNGSVKVYDARTGEEQLKINIATGYPRVVPAFSPDGSKLLLQTTDGNSITIHDATTGDIIKILKGHAREVLGASFSPDGERVPTRSRDGTAKIWDVNPTPGPLDFLAPQPGSEIRRIAFSQGDSSRIAVRTENTMNNQSVVAVWDVKSKTKTSELPITSGAVTGITFSPDRKWIVVFINSAGRKNSVDNHVVKVWNAETGQLLCTLTGHTDHIRRARLSPDGKWIVTASEDKTAKVWNARTGNVVRELSGHRDGLIQAEFSPDGRMILTASRDKTITFWDAESGTAQRTLSLDGEPNFAKFSPDGTRVLTTTTSNLLSGDTTVWEIATERSLFILPASGTFSQSSYSPDGTRIVTSNVTGPAQLFDAESGRELLTLSHPGGSARGAAFTPGGRWIVMHDLLGRIIVLDGTPLPEPNK